MAARLGADGWNVLTAERSTGFDLAGAAECERAVAQAGRLDALVVPHGSIVRRPALELGLDEWRRLPDVDLTAPFVLACAAAKRMPDGGAIVLLGSRRSFLGGVGTAAYAATKGCVVQLAKSLSSEWAGRGIRVNAVARAGSTRR